MGLLSRVSDWRRYRTMRRLDIRREKALDRMLVMRKSFSPQREEEGEEEIDEEEEEEEEEVRLSWNTQKVLFQKRPPKEPLTFEHPKTGKKITVRNITQGEWDAANNWSQGSAKGLCERAEMEEECTDKCVETLKKKLDAKRANYIHGLRKRTRKKLTTGKAAKQMLSEFIGPSEKRYLGRRVIQKALPLKDEK